MVSIRPISRVLLGSVLALILLCGLVLNQNHGKTTSSSIAATQSLGTATMQLPELGVQFDYPNSWKNFTFKRADFTGTGEKGFVYSSSGQYEGLYLSAYSADAHHDFTDPIVIPISVDWTADQFLKNQAYFTHILLSKKLSSKAVLVIEYSSVECSPGINLHVYTPFSEKTPNLRIDLMEPKLTSTEQKILSDYENSAVTKDGFSCQNFEAYQKIVDDWSKNRFPKELQDEIKMAQAVADSVKKL